MGGPAFAGPPPYLGEALWENPRALLFVQLRLLHGLHLEELGGAPGGVQRVARHAGHVAVPRGGTGELAGVDGLHPLAELNVVGLDEALLARYEDRCVRIPMREGARSLNLSNAVAIAAYEALRQSAFRSLR